MKISLAIPLNYIVIFSILFVSSTLPFVIENHLDKEHIYQRYQKEKLRHTQLKLKNGLIRRYEIPYDTTLLPINAIDLTEVGIRNGIISSSQIKGVFYPSIRRKYGDVPNFFIIFSPYESQKHWLITPVSTSFSPWSMFANIFTLWVVFFFLLITFSMLINHITFRRLTSIKLATQAIINGNLSKRLPEKFKRKTAYDGILKSINLMLDKLETLVSETKQVSNNIAHDLRKPLNRLKNRIEVALQDPRKPEEYQEILYDNIQDLDELIQIFNNLLLMGNLKSGASSYHFEAICLKDTLQNLYEYYITLAEEKSQQLVMDMPESPLYIKGNKSLITQAFSNLIDNAIKYTPNEGTITITLNNNASIAKVVISDTGIGIKKEEEKAVFEKFYRVDEARTTEGSGLGLSIVKAILEKHQATIKLSSNTPKGLKVTVLAKVYSAADATNENQ